MGARHSGRFRKIAGSDAVLLRPGKFGRAGSEKAQPKCEKDVPGCPFAPRYAHSPRLGAETKAARCVLMGFAMPTALILELLRDAKIELAPGLSEVETQRAETIYGFRFPPDLRELLQIALPISERFPDWRAVPNEFITGMMKWPLDGMLFDIEHDKFWMPNWGDKPQDLEAAFEIARREVAKVPKLIPIYAHRYLPAEPCESGNPVFSVYQMDIIYYGSDLLEYFRNELLRQYEITESETSPREIPFWSAVMDGEGWH